MQGRRCAATRAGHIHREAAPRSRRNRQPARIFCARAQCTPAMNRPQTLHPSAFQGYRWRDSNPHGAFAPTDFKSVVSAISPHRLARQRRLSLVLEGGRSHSGSWRAVYGRPRFAQSRSAGALRSHWSTSFAGRTPVAPAAPGRRGGERPRFSARRIGAGAAGCPPHYRSVPRQAARIVAPTGWAR